MFDSVTPWTEEPGGLQSMGLQSQTVVLQVPLSMEFCRQEYWSGLPFPSSEDLPNPGIKYRSPELQADSLLSEPAGKPTTHLLE